MARIRTSLVVGAAIGTVIAALIMAPRAPAHRHSSDPDVADDNAMTVSAQLVTSRILAGTHVQNIAVTITAPSGLVDLTVARPPLSLAVVVDRSGSMHGAAIENAKAAALSILQQLDSRDAFSIVTYSSNAESVIPIQRATDANKAAARAAIAAIYDDGGTCISCGLETGAYEVTHSPVRGGVRRILLISDGAANEGAYGRDELAELAARKASDGLSISTVGVGLDFDERTMGLLAELGRGSYYFVEDTVALSTMFSRELSSLGQTVATDALLVLRAGDGSRIIEAYGYPMTRSSSGEVFVPVADMRARESRKVVLRVAVGAVHEGPLVIAHAELRWRGVADGASHAARTTAEAEVVNEPSAVAASIDRPTLRAVEHALSARALQEAAAAYDRNGIAGARQILEQRRRELGASAAALGDEAAALDAVAGDAIEGFATAPDRARKAASVKAYELAR